MRKYNIVFLLRLWPICGGGETVTICNANEMVKRGHHVHILYFKDSDSDHQIPFIDDRIKLHRIENVQFNEQSKEFFVNKNEAFYVSTELITYVKANDIDIIINQWWPVEFLENVRIQTKAKVIKCLHMEPNTKKVFNYSGFKMRMMKMILPLYRYVEYWKHLYSCDKYLKHSDLFVFLAPSFLEWYRKRRPSKVVKEKTDFVYNPLVYKMEGNTDFDKKEKTVLYVGRLNEVQKQIVRILEIWKDIENDSSYEKWKLQIVGDGPDKKMYESYISRNHLRRVSLEGYQYPLPYYQQASIFVMTSAFEGFPMTLIESQQNGTVPIGMDTFQSIHDIITDNVNGFLVKDSNKQKFKEALHKLMDNSQMRRTLALNGLESCKRFEVEKIVDKWETIFWKLTFENAK